MGHIAIVSKKANKKSTFVESDNLATEIIAHRTSGFAPYNVQLTTDISDERKESFQFVWKKLGTQRVYKHLRANRPHGNDANTARGFMTAFAVQDIGETTFECDIFGWEDGVFKHQTISKTITALDPNDVFLPEETIAIDEDPNPTWEGARPGAHQVTSYVDAVLLAEDLGNTNIWIMGKRGQKLADGRKISTEDLSTHEDQEHKIAFSPYGPGTEKLRLTAETQYGVAFSHFNNIKTQISVWDVIIEGNYDPSTGRGERQDGIWDNTKASDVSILNVEIYNCMKNMIVRTEQTENGWLDNRYFTAVNCNVRGWEDYGCYLGKGSIAFAGTALIQDPNLKIASDAKQLGSDPNYPDHGPTRGAGLSHTIFTKCDVLSINGWSSGGLGHQPGIRMNANMFHNAFMIVSECVVEGGQGVTNIAMNSDQERRPSKLCMIEDNFIFGTEATGSFGGTSASGTVFRNNMCVMPNVPGFGALANFGSVFVVTRSSTEGQEQNSNGTLTGEQLYGNLENFILVYGNTFVDLRSQYYGSQSGDMSANDSELQSTLRSVGFTNTHCFNNIYYAPNRDARKVSEAPFVRKNMGEPLYKGSQWAEDINGCYRFENNQAAFGNGRYALGLTSGSKLYNLDKGTLSPGAGILIGSNSTGEFIDGETVEIRDVKDETSRGTFVIREKITRRLTEYAASVIDMAYFEPGYASRAKGAADQTRGKMYFDNLGRVRAETQWLGSLEIDHV